MRVKRSELLDYIIIFSIFLQLVILGFFGLTAFMNRIIAVLIFVRVLLRLRPVPKFSIIITGIVFLLFFLSALLGKRYSSALTNNLFLILYPMLYVFYGFYICRLNPDLIKRLLYNSFWVINGVMIINIIVMIIQINFPYSIQAVITANEIKFYEDTISGLFAYGSTHVVGLFYFFVMLYNLSYRKRFSKKNQRIIFWYTVVLLILNIYVSLNNDNKAFFFLLPLFIVLYLSLDNKRMSQKKIANILGIIILIILLFVFFYVMIPSFSRFIDTSIIGFLSEFVSSYKGGNSVVGSNERIAIVGYAFEQPNTWKFGMGIGAGKLGQSGLFGFVHFGQSDMGSFLLLLGIWFFIAIIVWYTYFCVSIVKGTSSVRLPRLFIIAFGIMFLVLSLYTQCFSKTNLATCVILIAMALYVKVQNVFDL